MSASPESTAGRQPHLPLAGLVVLDLAHYVAGPTVSRSLLDLGADVIKVEPPGGELMRAQGPKGPVWAPSPTFLALHRDKRSIVLDLKAPAGVQALKDLARHADVIVENFRPRVADRLGVGAAVMRAENPRLIYCTVNGFGDGGPLTDMPTTDGIVQAFSGIVEQLAPRGEDFAPPATFAIADLWAGSMTAQAVLAALYARERSGEGCHIDMTMLECALFARMLSTERGMVSPNTFLAEASDGVTLAVQTVPGMVARFLDLLRSIPECADMADDPRFATPQARIDNEELYLSRVRDAIARRTSDEWVTTFMAAGVPAAPVNTMGGALRHAQVVNRDAAIDFDVPGLGPTRLPAPPFVFDGHRVQHTSAPVELGVHTREVLRAVAGYTDEQIDALASPAR